MSETIQIMDEGKRYCTAKEAMRYAISYMETEQAHAIRKIQCSRKGTPDSEAELFIRMFGRYLHKNHTRVFLLAETDKLLAQMIEVLPERYTGIKIVSAVTMEEDGISDDMILNQINGEEIECIIAALSDESEDDFYEQYHSLLDTKIWVELGTNLRVKKKWDFPIRHFLKKD